MTPLQTSPTGVMTASMPIPAPATRRPRSSIGTNNKKRPMPRESQGRILQLLHPHPHRRRQDQQPGPIAPLRLVTTVLDSLIQLVVDLERDRRRPRADNKGHLVSRDRHLRPDINHSNQGSNMADVLPLITEKDREGPAVQTAILPVRLLLLPSRHLLHQ